MTTDYSKIEQNMSCLLEVAKVNDPTGGTSHEQLKVDLKNTTVRAALDIDQIVEDTEGASEYNITVQSATRSLSGKGGHRGGQKGNIETQEITLFDGHNEYIDQNLGKSSAKALKQVGFKKNFSRRSSFS